MIAIWVLEKIDKKLQRGPLKTQKLQALSAGLNTGGVKYVVQQKDRTKEF